MSGTFSTERSRVLRRANVAGPRPGIRGVRPPLPQKLSADATRVGEVRDERRLLGLVHLRVIHARQRLPRIISSWRKWSYGVPAFSCTMLRQAVDERKPGVCSNQGRTGPNGAENPEYLEHRDLRRLAEFSIKIGHVRSLLASLIRKRSPFRVQAGPLVVFPHLPRVRDGSYRFIRPVDINLHQSQGHLLADVRGLR